MNRLMLAGLLSVTSLGAQLFEIHVDAAVSEGVVRPSFGLDGPRGIAAARLLAERGTALEVRLGPEAALRDELEGALERVWQDEEEAPCSDIRSSTGEEGPRVVWGLPGEASAARVVALAIQLQEVAGGAAYYGCRGRPWFEGGEPTQTLLALELAGRLEQTRHRVRVQVEGDGQTRGLAAVSSDGELVQALLARAESRDGESGPPTYALYVHHLPWGASPFRIERYRVDAGSGGELVETGSGRGGTARILARFVAPAVELIVLRRGDQEPASGVIRRRRGSR